MSCLPGAEAACGDGEFCGPALECTSACTRHEQCPTAACDLAQGTCIDPAGRLAFVDPGAAQCASQGGHDWSLSPITYCSIGAALGDLAAQPQLDDAAAVIRIRATAAGYREVVEISNSPGRVDPAPDAIVLMADPSSNDRGPVEWTVPGTLDEHVIGIAAGSRVYLHGLHLVGSGSSTTHGVSCNGNGNGNGTTVWIDDVEIRGAATGIVADSCAIHVRRSWIHDNNTAGIDMMGGSLALESSVVARNGGVGLSLTNAEATIEFSSLLDNDSTGSTNIACSGSAPTRASFIDASIVLNPGVSTSIDCPRWPRLPTRTLTEEDFSPDVQLTDVFSNIARGVPRASEPTLEAGRVGWIPGDPYFDLDQDPRPHGGDGLVFVGADEPSVTQESAP